MRIVKEIPHSDLKITVFHWNNRYLIKFEAGLMEQTYKIQDFDVSSEEDIIALLDNAFIQKVVGIFQKMHESLGDALSALP